MISVLLLIVLPAAIFVWALVIGRLLRRMPPRLVLWQTAGVLAMVRIGALWWLILSGAAHGWERLLVIFLMPEGFLIPRGFFGTLSPSVPKLLLFSGVLLAGSILWAGLSVGGVVTIKKSCTKVST